MNKKIALVKLIRNSFIIPNEEKLELLGKIEGMSDQDVEEFGASLSAEHDFVMQNESAIRTDVGEIMETLKNWKPEVLKTESAKDPDKVYVGMGKP